MRSWDKRIEERLLDIPERIRGVVEYGVQHGVVIALAAAQVWLGHELCFLIDFSKGDG
jgi:hypothetical protein